MEVFAISSSTTIFRTFGLMLIFSNIFLKLRISSISARDNAVLCMIRFLTVIKKQFCINYCRITLPKGSLSNLWLKLSIKNYDILPEDIQVWFRKRLDASLCMWVNCGEEAILVWLASPPPSLKPTICDIFHSMFYCVQVLYTTNQQTSVFRDI